MASKTLPRISVVTPCFNSNATIRETLDSIAAQKYPALEYIVVDGGSTDGTIDTVLQYSSLVDVLLTGRDHTMYDAVAKGFDRATGEICTWLNSDDVFEPWALERAGTYFAEHPRCEVVYFEGLVWKDGWKIPNRLQKHVGFKELIDGHILYQDAVFFKRRAYEAVGGLNRLAYRLAGDYDLWLRLSAKYNFHYVRGSHVSCYRLSAGQLSADWGRYLQEMRAAQAKVRKTARVKLALSAPARAVRRIRSAISPPDPYYELENENAAWLPARRAPAHAGQDCRCPVCSEWPQRLLFTALDPANAGPPVARQIYYCSACEVAFVYPLPEAEEIEKLASVCVAEQAPSRLPSQPGYYSPFRRASLLTTAPLFVALGRRHLARSMPAPVVPSGTIVEMAPEGSASTRLDLRRAAHYKRIDIGAAEFKDVHARFRQIAKAGNVDTLVLTGVLQRSAQPVETLAAAAGAVRAGGRIWISVPNLDSAWLRYYGPCWSGWNVPLHRFSTGQKGIRKICERAGLRLKSLRSCSRPDELCISEAIAAAGLAIPVNRSSAAGNEQMRTAADAACWYSRWMYDPWTRGDELWACMMHRRRTP